MTWGLNFQNYLDKFYYESFQSKIHNNCVKCLSLDIKTKIYLFILIINLNLGSSVSVVVVLRTGILKELGVAQLVQWLYIRTGVLDESG